MQKKTQEITFDLPEDTILIDVIDEILKNNNLEETAENFFNLLDDSHTLIIQNTAIAMVEKVDSQTAITEDLTKKLGITQQTAEKIIMEINQKLIPYAKIINPEEETRHLQVVSGAREIEPTIKKVNHINVEENAKINAETKKFTDEVKRISQENRDKKFNVGKFSEEKKGSDQYREPIE